MALVEKTSLRCTWFTKFFLNKMEINFGIHTDLYSIVHNGHHKSLLMSKIFISYLMLIDIGVFHWSYQYSSSIKSSFFVLFKIVGFFLILKIFVRLVITTKVKVFFLRSVFMIRASQKNFIFLKSRKNKSLSLNLN